MCVVCKSKQLLFTSPPLYPLLYLPLVTLTNAAVHAIFPPASRFVLSLLRPFALPFRSVLSLRPLASPPSSSVLSLRPFASSSPFLCIQIQLSDFYDFPCLKCDVTKMAFTCKDVPCATCKNKEEREANKKKRKKKNKGSQQRGGGGGWERKATITCGDSQHTFHEEDFLRLEG